MDILQYAMELELKGKACYESLSASTRVTGFKTIFNGLAADEQKHYEVFRELNEGKSCSMDDSRILDRARSVFDELLADRERVISQLHEDLDAYRLGLQVEAETIKLYEDLARKEQDQEMAQLYLRLANEEKKHYDIVENIVDFVMRPKYYLEWREFGNLQQL